MVTVFVIARAVVHVPLGFKSLVVMGGRVPGLAERIGGDTVECVIVRLVLDTPVRAPPAVKPTTPAPVHDFAVIRCQSSFEKLTGSARRGRRRPPILRAHLIQCSYADSSLGPPTSCGSTGQDPFPVGNPRSHVSGAPSQPLISSNRIPDDQGPDHTIVDTTQDPGRPGLPHRPRLHHTPAVTAGDDQWTGHRPVRNKALTAV